MQQHEQLRSSSCIGNQIATSILSRQALHEMPEIFMSHNHAHCLQSGTTVVRIRPVLTILWEAASRMLKTCTQCSIFRRQVRATIEQKQNRTEEVPREVAHASDSMSALIDLCHHVAAKASTFKQDIFLQAGFLQVLWAQLPVTVMSQHCDPT